MFDSLPTLSYMSAHAQVLADLIQSDVVISICGINVYPGKSFLKTCTW